MAESGRLRSQLTGTGFPTLCNQTKNEDFALALI